MDKTFLSSSSLSNFDFLRFLPGASPAMPPSTASTSTAAPDGGSRQVESPIVNYSNGNSNGGASFAMQLLAPLSNGTGAIGIKAELPDETVQLLESSASSPTEEDDSGKDALEALKMFFTFNSAMTQDETDLKSPTVRSNEGNNQIETQQQSLSHFSMPISNSPYLSHYHLNPHSAYPIPQHSHWMPYEPAGLMAGDPKSKEPAVPSMPQQYFYQGNQTHHPQAPPSHLHWSTIGPPAQMPNGNYSVSWYPNHGPQHGPQHSLQHGPPSSLQHSQLNSHHQGPLGYHQGPPSAHQQAPTHRSPHGQPTGYPQAPEHCPQPPQEMPLVGVAAIPRTTHTVTGEKIRRPPNAFFIFSKDRRREILYSNRDLTNKEVSKMLGKQWYDLPDSQRAVYQQQAEELRQEHHAKYPGKWCCPGFLYKLILLTPSLLIFR